MKQKLRQKLREMSPHTADLVDEVQKEMVRLYDLAQSDQTDFGRQLLQLSREVRASYAELMSRYDRQTYEANFFTDLVPELAVRLGVPREELEPGEGKDPELAAMSNEDFRFYTNVFLRNVSVMAFMRSGRETFKPEESSERDREVGLTLPAAVLLNNVANGNPIAFGLDRVYPAPPEDRSHLDFIAEEIRSASKARGHEQTAEWHPGLQEEPPEHDGGGGLTL